MCEVQRLLDELGQTFNKFKEMRRIEMLKAFNNVRCCECGHKLRLRNAQETATRRKQFTTNRLIIVCSILLLLITIFFIHLARQYNHVTAYGSGGCISTIFYASNDCEVHA
ncbi:uncharacterized protein LOC117793827 [Drosophila innubila]|uniref:uncharacterized protein LOC117793827 n=1 Tax=Drosophila innubila TaxID=198719 RepID=UPI00148DC628|nr:uncharacterized protein LOC117793827 [Drosophila innubila]